LTYRRFSLPYGRKSGVRAYKKTASTKEADIRGTTLITAQKYSISFKITVFTV